MPQVVKSVLVPYTPAEMYDLVDDVEEYPKFLPWCAGTDLHVRDDETTEATLKIGYKSIRHEFTTVNSKRYPNEMLLRLKEGPFHHLDGAWHFRPLGDAACKIEFMLHYEFSSHLLEKALGAVFGHIVNSLVDAFVERAEKVYGER
ncbi:type II toxin-antitoxin system RatA family toxin [Parasulfuritortus cantonensis]|uniref:Type II toxin-antitoxin system RatA family toxin n=1 Tax=Parasulfuritortus cantonensis TaxID=2528202 RepID=A0A4R1BDK8_9PROT|nr:type II toxin-antitoxin system RatA family toxin [Parasulfuritortus cantonensis]TCJ15169.1 type II toxin-antitoxin system RatA family toxin [Parasulfuritortus cantonensis]